MAVVLPRRRLIAFLPGPRLLVGHPAAVFLLFVDNPAVAALFLLFVDNPVVAALFLVFVDNGPARVGGRGELVLCFTCLLTIMVPRGWVGGVNLSYALIPQEKTLC